jgi:hypothetical protein
MRFTKFYLFIIFAYISGDMRYKTNSRLTPAQQALTSSPEIRLVSYLAVLNMCKFLLLGKA